MDTAEEDLKPDRARIPGAINGVTGRDRLRAMTKANAGHQDNWAKHFGGPTSKDTAAAKDVETRVTAMNHEQNVENEFRKSQGMPVRGGVSAPTSPMTSAPAPGVVGTAPNEEAKAIDTAKADAVRNVVKTHIAQKAQRATDAASGAALRGQVHADAKRGIVERSTEGDVKFKDGSGIYATGGGNAVLASKYGRGSATKKQPDAPQQPATPEVPPSILATRKRADDDTLRHTPRQAPAGGTMPPAVTPATMAVSAASKIPIVSKGLERLRSIISGGKTDKQKQVAGGPSKQVTMSQPQAQQPPKAEAVAPAGASPTKSGGYMSITGAPKPQPPAVDSRTEMEKREVGYKRRQHESIYPETRPAHVQRVQKNAALVKKYKDGDRDFKAQMSKLPPRDRLRITSRLAAA
jgi:hypothetical protein